MIGNSAAAIMRQYWAHVSAGETAALASFFAEDAYFEDHQAQVGLLGFLNSSRADKRLTFLGAIRAPPKPLRQGLACHFAQKVPF